MVSLISPHISPPLCLSKLSPTRPEARFCLCPSSYPWMYTAFMLLRRPITSFQQKSRGYKSRGYGTMMIPQSPSHTYAKAFNKHVPLSLCSLLSWLTNYWKVLRARRYRSHTVTPCHTRLIIANPPHISLFLSLPVCVCVSFSLLPHFSSNTKCLPHTHTHTHTQDCTRQRHTA